MSDSETTTQQPQRLTSEDPVSKETLEEFNRLEEARYNVGIQLLQMEQNRVRLLAAAHQVDEHQRRLFEKVLVDRGLPPTTQVSIDSTTGKLAVMPKSSEDSA